MSSQGDAFRADCERWVGHQPCDVQLARDLPDCTDCTEFIPVENEVSTQTVYIRGTQNEPRSIGIVEAGGLGSVLRTTAVSRALRLTYPDADLYWFTHDRGRDLLRYVPGVMPLDIAADDSLIQARQLDVLVNYELNEAVSPIVKAARHVLGFTVNEAGKFHGVLPDTGYMQRLQIDNGFRRNINRQTMQKILLKSAGLGSEDAQYDTLLNEGNYSNASRVVNDIFSDFTPESIISLVPGTSHKGAVRRWPVEYFAKLAHQLSRAYPMVGTIITRGPEDDAVVEELAPLVQGRLNIGVMPASIDIGDYLALISKSKLVVSGDTFGMHAAFSQRTPVITIEGPSPIQEIEAGPNDVILSAGLDCAPCYGRCTNPILSHCMKSVSVDQVFDEVADQSHTLTAQQLSGRC
jgi:ADP-heptose:LPS heptosyltransferase